MSTSSSHCSLASSPTTFPSAPSLQAHWPVLQPPPQASAGTISTSLFSSRNAPPHHGCKAQLTAQKGRLYSNVTCLVMPHLILSHKLIPFPLWSLPSFQDIFLFYVSPQHLAPIYCIFNFSFLLFSSFLT